MDKIHNNVCAGTPSVVAAEGQSAHHNDVLRHFCERKPTRKPNNSLCRFEGSVCPNNNMLDTFAGIGVQLGVLFIHGLNCTDGSTFHESFPIPRIGTILIEAETSIPGCRLKPMDRKRVTTVLVSTTTILQYTNLTFCLG